LDSVRAPKKWISRTPQRVFFSLIINNTYSMLGQK
jgi:hypothetical protein